jgi:hypothetical protein
MSMDRSIISNAVAAFKIQQENSMSAKDRLPMLNVGNVRETEK